MARVSKPPRREEGRAVTLLIAVVTALVVLWTAWSEDIVDPTRLPSIPHALVKPHFKSNAHRCPAGDIENLDSKKLLQSQSEEDEYLLDWFNGLCGGSYIEMGALDGKQYSNSYVFNKAFRWKGVLIEANPKSFASLL